MDGILIIDKADGLTSHDVVNRVRRTLKTKRVGHTGTLDPFATGVLVLLVGKATRLAQFLDKDEKEYEGVIRFGFETDTGDVTGKALTEDQLSDSKFLERIDWDDVVAPFRGDIEQVPPMYSAKKVEGKKLYESARIGVNVDRKPVRVTIRKLDLTVVGDSECRIHVVCSAGTYIRTLAEDIGRAVGLGAHLKELRRTRAGKFSIEEGVRLEELKNADDPSKFLCPIEEAVEHLPVFILPNDRIERTINGLATRVVRDDLRSGGAVRMLDGSGGLIAIGAYQSKENSIKPKIVLV